MLDLFGPTVHIGCSATGVAVLRRDRFGRSIGVPVERHLSQPLSLAELARELPIALAAAKCERAVATVVLADDWLRLFVVTPPSNCSHRRDCDAAIAMRFQALFGDDLAQWAVQADWQIDRPFLVAAMPLVLHQSLQTAATLAKLRFSAVLPHTVAAWNRWHDAVQRDDWFGIAHADVLTLISLEAGVPRAVRRQQLDQTMMKNPAWLSEHVGREALRLNLTVPPRVQLCGEVPQPWTTAAPGRVPCAALLDRAQLAGSSDAALAFAGVAR